MDDLSYRPNRGAHEIWAASFLGVLLYTIAAVLLTLNSVSRYDSVVDRPDQLRNEITPEMLRKILEASAKAKEPVSELA